jgi:hypothetical protein
MRRFLLISVVLLTVAVAGLLVLARSILGSDLVRSTLERQLAARTGQPVRIARATAAVYPRVAIDLENVSIGEPAAIELSTVRVVTGLGGLWSRTVTDAEVVVHGGWIALPLPFPIVQPPAAPGPDPQSGGFRVQSVRVISLRDIELRGAGRTVHVHLESSLDGDRLDVTRLTAHAERTHVEATGSMSSLARLEGRLDVKADPFDLDESIAVASALGGGGDPGQPQRTGTHGAVPIHLTAAVSAPSGTYGTYRFTNLSTDAELTPGRLALSPLSVETFGGTFSGRLDVNTGEAVPKLALKGRLEGVDVPQLLAAAGSAGGVTGTLGATLALTGEGTDAAALLRSSRGTLSAVINDGRIPGLDMVRAIVLAFGKPSGAPPPGSGSAFSRLGGTFSLAGSTLTSRDLAMHSRDFDMAGSGSVRLDTGALEARADVVLSKELTAQAGTDLRRYAQEGGRVVIPATIGGTLQHPSISLDIAAAAGRALSNELKRRATSLLEKLLKKREE